MANAPSTVEEATAYVWHLPDTVLLPSEKQSLNVLLAKETDVVASRYFSAPFPDLWVGTLKQLLKSTGILLSSVHMHSWDLTCRKGVCPTKACMLLCSCTCSQYLPEMEL